MSQSFADALSWVPVSATFSGTLGRAHEYARAQGHRNVTLEHLLLALAEDPDAAVVLQASNIDIARVMSDASTHLGHNEDRFAPGQPLDPGADEALVRILDYAAAAARQSRRREINGAIVLAAIVGEARSVAASMLQAQGLTFEGAIRALQRAPAAAPRPQPAQPAPPPAAVAPPPGPPVAMPHQPPAAEPPATINGSATQTNEQILASVRRRIDANRSAAKPVAAAPVAAPVAPPPPVAPAPARPSEPDLMVPPPPPAVALPIDEPMLPPPAAPVSPEPPRLETMRVPEPPRSPVFASPLPSASAKASYADNYAAGSPPLAELPPYGTADGLHRESLDTNAVEAIRAEIEDALPPRRPPPIPPGATPAYDAPPLGGVLGGAPPSPLRPRQLGAPVAPPSSVAWPEPVRPQPAALPPALSPPPMPQPSLGAPYAEPDPFDGGIAGPPYPEPDTVPPRPVANMPVPVPRPTSARTTAPVIEPGQLAENIPRRMQVGRAEIVEVRIGRAGARGIAAGMHGLGAVNTHDDVIVTKVMSAKLRAVDGGFTIESASPESQWIENHLGSFSDEFASWRWSVTPQRRGAGRLQLVVSARTVSAEGLVADTALPDQVFEVTVKADYARLVKRAAGWAGLMLTGGVLSRMGQGGFETVAALWRGFQ